MKLNKVGISAIVIAMAVTSSAMAFSGENTKINDNTATTIKIAKEITNEQKATIDNMTPDEKNALYNMTATIEATEITPSTESNK